MDFHTYNTSRDTAKKAGRIEEPDAFYRAALNNASQRWDGIFTSQLIVEQAWEQARRPYYNVWPSIVPMLTRLNLELDSTLIRLPLPAICVRLPSQQNPLAFDWQGQPTQIRTVLMGEAREGQSIVLLIDQGDTKRVGTVDHADNATEQRRRYRAAVQPRWCFTEPGGVHWGAGAGGAVGGVWEVIAPR